MALEQVNIRLVLGRLRPGAAYHWKGNNRDSGYGSLDDCIGEWRSVQPIPTEAEILNEWDAHLAEEDEATTLRQTILTNAQSAVGKTLDTLTAGERNALLALLLYKAGGVDPQTGMVNPLQDWVRR